MSEPRREGAKLSNAQLKENRLAELRARRELQEDEDARRAAEGPRETACRRCRGIDDGTKPPGEAVRKYCAEHKAEYRAKVVADRVAARDAPKQEAAPIGNRDLLEQPKREIEEGTETDEQRRRRLKVEKLKATWARKRREKEQQKKAAPATETPPQKKKTQRRARVVNKPRRKSAKPAKPAEPFEQLLVKLKAEPLTADMRRERMQRVAQKAIKHLLEEPSREACDLVVELVDAIVQL